MTNSDYHPVTPTYDYDDSYFMALSYLSSVIEEQDDESTKIETLLGDDLASALLQLNLVLYYKVQELLQERDGASQESILEKLRSEHYARMLNRNLD